MNPKAIQVVNNIPMEWYPYDNPPSEQNGYYTNMSRTTKTKTYTNFNLSLVCLTVLEKGYIMVINRKDISIEQDLNLYKAYRKKT